MIIVIWDFFVEVQLLHTICDINYYVSLTRRNILGLTAITHGSSHDMLPRNRIHHLLGLTLPLLGCRI